MPRKKPDAAAPAAASPAPAAPPRKRRPPNGCAGTDVKSAKMILDELGIDAILDKIEAGQPVLKIAAELGITRRRLNEWVDETDEKRSAVRAARIEASHAYALKAEEVLTSLASDSTQADIAKARELASHYRWMAKAISPADYGDRQTIEVKTPEVADMTDEEIDREVAKKAAALARAGLMPAGTVLQ